MIYLHRYTATDDGQSTDVAIAVVEDAGHTEYYESRGYSRCTLADYRAAWRLKDEQRLVELWESCLQERSVGGM